MNYKNKSIIELHDAIVNGEFTITQLTEEVIKNLKADWGSNAVLTLPVEEMLEQAKKLDAAANKDGVLFGIPYLAKDNFSTKGIRTTASSKILDTYKPVFDATVIEALSSNNALMSGKAALDELGMGGTGLYSAYGVITNPRDHKRLVGGSSSGSVYGVAKGYVPFATGSDTGDSIRKPASYNGVVGFKPTYGAISRYGILPYAPSLDTVGFFTRTVDDMAILSDATFSYDKKDFTSIEIEQKDFFKNIDKIDAKTKFGYLKNVQENLEPELAKAYNDYFDKLRAQGFEVIELNYRQDLLEALAPVYMMISFSEAVSTSANLDGINFGTREAGEDFAEIMTNTRTKNFGEIVKRRFLIGALNLRRENQIEFLIKAKQVRRLIVEETMKAFDEVDILILPPSTTPAPLIDAAVEFDKNHNEDKEFLDDILTIANFAGLPSITVPFIEVDGMPIGINLNAKPKADLKVLQAAKLTENITGIKNRIVED